MEDKKLTGYPSVDKPWLKYYSEEAINAKLPECTIYEYLNENNKEHLDNTALIYFNRKILYKELFENIKKVVKALVAIDVKKGDIVTVAMPSIPEAVYSVYAINAIGAIANFIHPLAGSHEIINYINEVKSKATLMFDGTYRIVESLLDTTSSEYSVVVTPAESLTFPLNTLYKLKNKCSINKRRINILSWKEFISNGERTYIDIKQGNCDDIAIISHTGGTTGEPKGVMLTNRNINAAIWQVCSTIPHDRKEKFLVVLPPFINYSLVNSTLEPLAFGLSAVLVPNYNPSKFDCYIKRYRPNHINSIPAYLEAILSNPKLERMELPCLKTLTSGGDGLSNKTENEINHFLLSHGVKCKLTKGLGSTEMVGCATFSYSSCNEIGSVGIPLVRVNCKIVAPGTQAELTYKQEGEICFSGVTLMQGYYNNETETDRIVKVHSDGKRWLHTGDLGYITENGVIYVTGRMKRMIITKGKDNQATKMFPDRIEKVILEHPAVNLCCVVGVSDAERIHYPRAAVVLNENTFKSNSITNEIRTICKEKLPEYMIPDEIVYLTEMPRTARGKIDYRKLEEMAAVDVDT